MKLRPYERKRCWKRVLGKTEEPQRTRPGARGTVFILALECGHTTRRVSSKVRKLKQANCETCEAKAGRA